MKSSLKILTIALTVAAAVLAAAGPSSEQSMSHPGALSGDEKEAVAVDNSFNGSFRVASTSNISPRLAYSYAVLWKVDFTLPQPERHMQEIEDDAQVKVESAMIKEGGGNSLKAKPEALKNKPVKVRTQVSCSVLQTYIDRVEAMLSAGWLSLEEAKELIDEANNVMFELRC